MTLRRTFIVVVLAAVAAIVGYTAWLVYQVQADLSAAQSSAIEFQRALVKQETTAREEALDDLREHAGEAEDRTQGSWWGALTHLPVFGDDASGVRAMSSSLDTVADGAVEPLSTAADGLDGVVGGGGVDYAAVRELSAPVDEAEAAVVDADDEVSGLDSSGFIGPLQTRFDRYSELVSGLRSGLGSAGAAIDVLPAMAGADGPRDYLFVFQNNAEIRSTGGLPGSWALLHAEDGRISITRQGTASDFPHTKDPVLPLTDEEKKVYGKALGTYFQDPGFTPDFPRAAELFQAHWDAKYPDEPIDGVVALDPVAISYLIPGTGSIRLDNGTVLTARTAVRSLLSDPYIKLDTEEQDELFAQTAREVFAAVTDDLSSPVAFVQGLNRAAAERRLLVASFDDDVAEVLSGTQVEGALAGDDGETPHVDVGLNDLTGSKMSYYLRYANEVAAVSCPGGTQRFDGTFTLRQSISPGDAAELPKSVTGPGSYFGTEPGTQYVLVRLYGPYGGTIDRVTLDSKTLPNLKVEQINGRPVVSVDVLLDNRADSVLAWQATAGDGQTGDVVVGSTPTVAAMPNRQVIESACGG